MSGRDEKPGTLERASPSATVSPDAAARLRLRSTDLHDEARRGLTGAPGAARKKPRLGGGWHG